MRVNYRDLYKFEGYDIGGKYKAADNIIEKEDEQGNKFVRYRPISAWETPEEIENLCIEKNIDSFGKAIWQEKLPVRNGRTFCASNRNMAI